MRRRPSIRTSVVFHPCTNRLRYAQRYEIFPDGTGCLGTLLHEKPALEAGSLCFCWKLWVALGSPLMPPVGMLKVALKPL